MRSCADLLIVGPAGAGRETVAARGGGRAGRLDHAGARGGSPAGRRQGAGGDAEPRGARAPDVGGAISRPDQGADRHRGLCGGGGGAHRDSNDLVSIAVAEEAMRAESEATRARPAAGGRTQQDLPFRGLRGGALPILVEIIRALWLKAGPVINLDLRDNPDGWQRATRSSFTPMCATPSRAATARPRRRELPPTSEAPPTSSCHAAASPTDILPNDISERSWISNSRVCACW